MHQPHAAQSSKGANEFSERLELEARKEVVSEWLGKPSDLKVNKVSNTGRVFLSITRNTEQERVFVENGFSEPYKVLLQKKSEERGKGHNIREEEEESCLSFVPDYLEAETAYTVRVKAELQEKENVWNKETEFATPEFSELCVWKECPDYVEARK